MVQKKQAIKTASNSRRDFLKVAGAGTAAATLGVVTLSSKEAAAAETFDAEYDIVVCGGGAGLPVALFSRWLGNKVMVLEKAATLGGTSFKAPTGTGCPTIPACARPACRTTSSTSCATSRA